MILDKQLTLADALALGNTGTNVCTNSIDLGLTGTIPGIGGTPIADLGRGAREGKKLFIQMTETAAASGGAAEANFQLINSDNADLSSPVVVQTTGAIAKATLVAGYRPRLSLPAGLTKRYLGVQVVVTTNNMTAGKYTAGLVMDDQNNMSMS